MAIDPTAKKANIRLSLKKYFIDTFETAKSKTVLFDDLFSLPQVQTLTEWLAVKFGGMSRGGLSELIVEILCATRKDPDGDHLCDLADLVFDAMTDPGQPDGKLRITLYETSQTPWAAIDSLLVQDIVDSPEMDGPDGTKYQVLTLKIKWAAKA